MSALSCSLIKAKTAEDVELVVQNVSRAHETDPVLIAAAAVRARPLKANIKAYSAQAVAPPMSERLLSYAGFALKWGAIACAGAAVATIGLTYLSQRNSGYMASSLRVSGGR